MSRRPAYPPPGLFPGGSVTPAGGGDPYYYQNGQLPHDVQAPQPGPYIDSAKPWPAEFPNKPYPPPWEGPRKPWANGGAGQGLIFADPSVAGVVARATWQSPTFNLRPEFFSIPSGNTDNTQIIDRVNAYGNGVTLQTAINGVANIPADVELTVTAFDLVHPFDPYGLFVANLGEDVTSDFFATSGAASLPFACPAGPPAFWAVRLQFDVTGGTIGQMANLLRVFAACY